MSAVESMVRRRPLEEPVPLERSRVPRGTVALARHLLGKVLVRRFGKRLVTGRIVETEAYLQGDPACHAFRGMTARNRSLFLDVGHAYVYLCYGTSWMLNVSSEAGGTGEGVLLRALEPLAGIERMRRGTREPTRRRHRSRPGPPGGGLRRRSPARRHRPVSPRRAVDRRRRLRSRPDRRKRAYRPHQGRRRPPSLLPRRQRLLEWQPPSQHLIRSASCCAPDR